MEQVRSKVTAKYQATIPGPIREHLKLKHGDTVEFAVVDDQVVLRRSVPMDVEYLRALNDTLSEWNSPEDDEAFNNL